MFSADCLCQWNCRLTSPHASTMSRYGYNQSDSSSVWQRLSCSNVQQATSSVRLCSCCFISAPTPLTPFWLFEILRSASTQMFQCDLTLWGPCQPASWCCNSFRASVSQCPHPFHSYWWHSLISSSVRQAGSVHTLSRLVAPVGDECCRSADLFIDQHMNTLLQFSGADSIHAGHLCILTFAWADAIIPRWWISVTR